MEKAVRVTSVEGRVSSVEGRPTSDFQGVGKYPSTSLSFRPPAGASPWLGPRAQRPLAWGQGGQRREVGRFQENVQSSVSGGGGGGGERS